MKQSIGKRVFGSESYWDGDEVAVAEILVDLLELIPARDFSVPSSAWGAKRRRSAISQPAPPPPPQQPPPSVSMPPVEPAAKSNAVTSPATPLMFSLSESDDKAKTPSLASFPKRKNKEELVQSLTDLTHQKDSLVKEMEAVKRHLDNLRASNVELKLRKQVIIYGLSQPPLQTLHHHQQHLRYPHQQQQTAFHLQQRPGIQWSSFMASSQSPASSAIAAGSRSKMAPAGLPDLNLSIEEAVNVERCQPSDAMRLAMDYNVNRALASAQARKRRMQIYKEKSQSQILRQR
uniref:Uncharacterized protein n=1 Tax=Kalanchoe fedtschenkoi TaxID=63787 RepID=A0A7N0V2I1_KALFE